MRKGCQQPLGKCVDGIDTQAPAGTIENGGEQRSRAGNRILARRRTDGFEPGEQLRLRQPHPFRQRTLDARRHFGRARLGKGQAQYLRWLHA